MGSAEVTYRIGTVFGHGSLESVNSAHWSNGVFDRSILERFASVQLISASVGFFLAVFLIGPEAIWPTNTEWLHASSAILNKGDAAASQITWNYFRHTPLFQWPITLVPDYGAGWSTNFIGAGGNGLIGIPLKFLNFILPDDFQYLGLWATVCFSLQGFFAAKVLSCFLSSRTLIIFFSINFTIAPVFIYRIGLMSHSNLGAQWLLLCAIYLYVSRCEKVWKWTLLVAVSHLIEIYMSAMILLLIVVYFISKIVLIRETRLRLVQLKFLIFPFATSGIFLWLLGFFALPNGVKGDGFFRFGATTYFDPRTSDFSSSSLTFNQIRGFSSQTVSALAGESYTYLGTGILLGVMVCSSFFIKSLSRINSHYLLLSSLGGLLFMVGLSRMVSIGPFEFTYWWPAILENARQVFRAATRFSWLLYYLIYITVFVTIGRLGARIKVRLIAAILLLSVTILDQFPLYASTFSYFRGKPETSVLVESNNDAMFGQYSKVNIYPVFDLQKDRSTVLQSELRWRLGGMYTELLLTTSRLRISSNFAYQSRSVGNVIDIENRRLRERMGFGQIDPGELYAFSSAEDQRQFYANCLVDVLVFDYRGVYFVGRPN